MSTSRLGFSSCSLDKLRDRVMPQFPRMFTRTRINRLVLVLLWLLSGVLLRRLPVGHHLRDRPPLATFRHGVP